MADRSKSVGFGRAGHVATVARFAAIAIVAVELWLLSRPFTSWASGFVPVAATLVLSSCAVGTEWRPGIRRVLGGALLVTYLVWMTREDGHWRLDAFWKFWAAVTAVEGLFTLALIEAREWRWTLLPATVFIAMLGYHVLTGLTGALLVERVIWIAQMLVLLTVHAGRRMMLEDGHFKTSE